MHAGGRVRASAMRVALSLSPSFSVYLSRTPTTHRRSPAFGEAKGRRFGRACSLLCIIGILWSSSLGCYLLSDVSSNGTPSFTFSHVAVPRRDTVYTVCLGRAKEYTGTPDRFSRNVAHFHTVRIVRRRGCACRASLIRRNVIEVSSHRSAPERETPPVFRLRRSRFTRRDAIRFIFQRNSPWRRRGF